MTALRALRWAMASIALVAMSLPGQVGPGALDHPSVARAARPIERVNDSMRLDEAPAGLRHAVQGALARETYRIRPRHREPGASLAASNRAQDFEASFGPAGATIASEGSAGAAWRWGLRLDAYGYPGHLVAVSPTAPVLADQRVEYRWEAITEWYENDERGVEHGFTLDARPPGRTSGAPLLIQIGSTGSLGARLERGQVVLAPPRGSPMLRYGGLVVVDVTGRQLAARMEATAGQIQLVIDDTPAVYPVTVDPLIASEEAQLTASDAEGSDHFGISVAVSGATALVGAYFDNTPAGNDAGSAYASPRSDRPVRAPRGAPRRDGCSPCRR